MYLGVINVKPLDNYKLKLVFTNNETRIFDITPYLDTGVISKLQEQAMFKAVHVNYDTIEWANGADLDPEDLYEKSQPIHSKKIV